MIKAGYTIGLDGISLAMVLLFASLAGAGTSGDTSVLYPGPDLERCDLGHRDLDHPDLCQLARTTDVVVLRASPPPHLRPAHSPRHLAPGKAHDAPARRGA